MRKWRVKIKKDGRDWVGRCRYHYEAWTADSWDDVYEMAAGHLCMKHPNKPSKDAMVVVHDKETPDLRTGRPQIYWDDPRMEERL